VSYTLGVELGTTFVAAARSHRSQVEMVTLGDRAVVMPAVVYVGEDGAVVIGEAANRRGLASSGRVARQFKRRLGDPTPLRLGEAVYTASELLAVVLREVLARVSRLEGEAPAEVVLTHPANWGPFRRGVFEEVPGLAGVSQVRLVTEPEAAALHYAAARQLDDGALVAVYDLGGGTFDATVVRKLPDGVHTLGTPEGIERLGGIDFDQALFDFVNFSCDGALTELDMRDSKTSIALNRLRQDCALAKESLSVDTETVLPVFLPDRQFDLRITRGQFEDLIRAHVESTITALSRTLRSAGVSAEELSAVLLVGGSSQIPLVARMVSEELGRPILADTHPKYAVALGAATLAHQPAPPLPAAQAPTRPARQPTHQPGGERPRHPALPTRLRAGAAALLLAGIAAVAWVLLSRPDAPPRPPQASPPSVAATSTEPPTTLAPPRHVPIAAPGAKVYGFESLPSLYTLGGSSFSEIDPATFASRWTIELPVPTTGFMYDLGNGSLCIKTKLTECIPVNPTTRTLGPTVQLPADMLISNPVGDGKHIAVLRENGQIAVMDVQTQATRSVQIVPWRRPPWPKLSSGTGGTSLFGASGHHVFVVDNDEAPDPVLSVVNTDTMAVTTMPWPRKSRPPGEWAMTIPFQSSPDGKTLYAVRDQGLLVFDMESLALKHKFPLGSDTFAPLNITPDGRYLYVLTTDGLRVIEASTGRQVSVGNANGDNYYNICVFDGGRQMALVNEGEGGYDLFDMSAFVTS
jgi:actin-like ATPase involved in cell morphogenesis